MNNCTFTGIFTDSPKLEKKDDVSFIEFTLAVANYRKTKTGEKAKTITYLPFEAWHTGAETIAKFAKQGTQIIIQASAKSSEDSEKENCVIFRVNEFNLIG